MTKLSGDFAEYLVDDGPFADGRSGVLYRCRGGHVLKEYREPVTDHKAVRRLRRLRELGQAILVQESQELGSSPEASVNWPVDLITDDGSIRGVILPEIPRRFYREPRAPRTLDWMLLARGDPPGSAARISILIRLCEIFEYLQEREFVHGDLSSKNVVWAKSGEAYLLDADGLQPQRPSPTSGFATPRWRDPRLVDGSIPAHDHYSDRYALALAVYRGLLLNPGNLDQRANGRWPSPSSLPRDLDGRVRGLIERALCNPLDARARPTPARWIDVLTEAFVLPTGFDRTKLRVLDDAARAQNDRQAEKARIAERPRPAPTAPLGSRPVSPPAATSAASKKPSPKSSPTRRVNTSTAIRDAFLLLAWGAIVAVVASAMGAYFGAVLTVGYEETGRLVAGDFGTAFSMLLTYSGACLVAMVVADLSTALVGREDAPHPAWPYVLFCSLGLLLWFHSREPTIDDDWVPTRESWLFPPLGIAVAHIAIRLYQTARHARTTT